MMTSIGGAAVKKGALFAAIAVVAAAWLGPLPDLALERFAAQAALHVVLATIVAPLLAASIAGTRYDPVRRWAHRFSPLGFSLLQAAVVWVWLAPAAQAAEPITPGLLWLEQVTILLAAVLLWMSVLGGDRATRYERVGAGIVALLMMSVHMTLLGGMALISSSPFVGDEIAAFADDRRTSGLVTLAGAAIVYAIAGALLLAWLLKPGLTDASRVTTASGRS